MALLLAKITNDVVSVRFLLFCLVGLSGVGVHMLTLFLGMSAGDLSFETAQIAATIMAITSNYLFNNMFTYSDLRLRGFRFFLGWTQFILICGIGAMSSFGIANELYEEQSTWQIAGLAGAFVSVFWNYMVSAIFVWHLR